MAQLLALFNRLTWKEKLSIATVALVVSGALWLGIRWNRERDLRPLFTNLSVEDAGTIVERLRTANVTYKVSDGGVDLVPSARVAELRLQMAASGLPRSGRIGFELFDKANFGTTDFAEQVNYRRAIEGELERSFAAIAEVERARVHVTFAKESVFLDNREPAKASVMLQLRPGTRLSSQNILGITHLAASAVEGLQPENVSVLDMTGALLNRPRRAGDEEASASDAMTDYRQGIEREMLAKIRASLDPLLGAEKYRAGVAVDCDFTSGEQSEEIFDPDKSVMANSQKTEDVSGSAAAAGVPGTASNLPRPLPKPATGGSGVARRTESITYQTSRLVKRLKLPQGTVRRVSVSVLVDHDARWEGKGAQARWMLEPPSPERLKVVRDVVAGVVGFQEQRGDQILIESMPFDATLHAPARETPSAQPVAGLAVPLPEWLKAWLDKALTGAGLAALAALLVVFLVAAFWVWRRLRRGPRNATIEPGRPALSADQASKELEQKALAQLAANEAERERQEQEMLASLMLPPSTKKAEVLKKHIGDQARRDPAATAQLIRTWLSEQER
jgi:flagellar M-ring protein FliF